MWEKHCENDCRAGRPHFSRTPMSGFGVLPTRPSHDTNAFDPERSSAAGNSVHRTNGGSAPAKKVKPPRAINKPAAVRFRY